MERGWISLNRSIRDHWLYLEKRKFSYYEAWLDILMDANHVENKILMSGELIQINRGQFITSIRKLGERWGWSRTKVKSFLDLLESDSMVIVKSDTKKTLITVVNYDNYQNMDISKRHRSDTEKHQKDTNNNVNKINKDIVEQPLDTSSPTEIIKEIIDYLNQKLSTRYKSTTKVTQTKIKARLAEGFTVDDFKKVIDNKASEWLYDADMSKYLRPETLFGSKFESYLNQLIVKDKQKSSDFTEGKPADLIVPEEFRYDD